MKSVAIVGRAIQALLVLSLSTIAQASEEGGQNVYDVFRQWLKPSPDASVDEQVTARIKRHMANLLYPVDMASFVGPDKDEKFRDLIMVLQKQLNAPPTGILTSSQFDLLQKASQDVDASLVVSGQQKFISRVSDGNMLTAVGTGTMDDIAFPINKVHIVCIKQEASCEYREASFDLKTQMLDLNDLIYYDIKTWAADRITAIREHQCGTATMTIDVKAQDVTIVGVSHSGSASCRNEQPSVWRLVDGFPVAWKLNQERRNGARTLLYPAARKFFPMQ
jgi:hypothetical protein